MDGSQELLAEIESSICESPAIWWLGGAGFALRYRGAAVYVNFCLKGARSSQAGLLLCTQPERLDPETIPAMLSASPRFKLVIPKSLADYAHSLGIAYSRMVTTDAGLRVEYLDDRIYAVPSAHPKLDWTPIGGYPYLGYLVRFGGVTFYHSGDCVPYEDLADRLRPYSVTVAMLPIGGPPDGFEIAEAAQLAEDIGARWLIPFPAAASRIESFIDHMLGHRPAQAFKICERGVKWTVPE